MKNIKNEKEIFEEILENYENNIEEYSVIMGKTGKQQKHRKLKDDRYEKELNNIINDVFSRNERLNKELKIKLKLGMPYNRSKSPWIQLYYLDKNSKGTRGRYAGISFDMEQKKVQLWTGFGMTRMETDEIIETNEKYTKQYQEMYGQKLERGFQYASVYVSATIISKEIDINEFDNEEFKKDIAYLTDLYVNFESKAILNNDKLEETISVKEQQEDHTFKKSAELMGKNIIYKGFPGSGKSHIITEKYLKEKGEYIDEGRYERVTFYSEYTNAEFVGTIKPCIKNNIPTYQFIPGPFTKILKRAIENSETNFYLVIEEINRGEAASIFGDIFQLLDRENENGRSTFSITNSLIADYIYKDENKKIYIPANLSIIASMNVSDENVKTLDNAFERRWEDIWIFDTQGEYDNRYIKGMESITWGKFRRIINNAIKAQQGILKNEDKQLGAYFIRSTYVIDTSENNDNSKDRERFLYKVIINLYTKVCKYDKTLIFDEEIKSIDDLQRVFLQKDYLKIFKEEIKDDLIK